MATNTCSNVVVGEEEEEDVIGEDDVIGEEEVEEGKKAGSIEHVPFSR